MKQMRIIEEADRLTIYDWSFTYYQAVFRNKIRE
jgi:hypothetical protein